MTPNSVELALIDRWQRDFPVVERPFAIVGQPLGLDEGETMSIFQRLREKGVVSRIGAVVRPHTVGASTLAAMQVPAARLDEVADIVSREPAVNHNYQRSHAFNLWFVVAAGDAEAVAATLHRIEQASGLAVLRLPLVRAYHVDLGFSLSGEARSRSGSRSFDDAYRADAFDRSLLGILEDGLPIVERPYREIADSLGATEVEIHLRLRRLTDAGVVSRFGCVLQHRALGYTANAMAVWDIADDRVDDVGRHFAQNPSVTLCYRRPRQNPDWPYNLFCMVHAKTEAEALAVIDDLKQTPEAANARQAVLFSVQCFKQRGATFKKSREGLH
jgi:DNA-binding Lrp family transcriptional regulator